MQSVFCPKELDGLMAILYKNTVKVTYTEGDKLGWGDVLGREAIQKLADDHGVVAFLNEDDKLCVTIELPLCMGIDWGFVE